MEKYGAFTYNQLEARISENLLLIVLNLLLLNFARAKELMQENREIEALFGSVG